MFIEPRSLFLAPARTVWAESVGPSVVRLAPTSHVQPTLIRVSSARNGFNQTLSSIPHRSKLLKTVRPNFEGP